jgi:hypothetical protein
MKNHFKISTPALLDLEVRGYERVMPISLSNMPMDTFLWDDMVSLINAKI